MSCWTRRITRMKRTQAAPRPCRTEPQWGLRDPARNDLTAADPVPQCKQKERSCPTRASSVDGGNMKGFNSMLGAAGLVAAASLAATCALAQQKEIKIGLIFDQTGPFAGGGSVATQLGSKYAIDITNERGGVEGYKIVPIFAD